MEKEGKLICVFFCIVIFSQNPVTCATINDTKTLISDLLSDYNINVRPVVDQSDAVNVSVEAYIKSIQEFDEVQGKFAFIGALFLTWYDVNMMWDPAQYGGVYTISLLYPNVWVPELLLSSPSDDVSSLGQKWNRVRFYYNGYAIWLPIDLIESTCSVNVRNYPFDTQMCTTSFNTLGYSENEVRLIAAADEFLFDVYQENSIWSVKKSEVTISTVGDGSQLNLILYLNRKPSFVIINMVLPILFLSLLNVLVFLLIPESGERVSYCITVLLAIAVFMTIVSDMLPRSSEPVPVISIKLMIDMIISSFIVLTAILNLNLYYRDESVPIPPWLISLYNLILCVPCSQKKVVPKLPEIKRMNSKISAKVKTINVAECKNEPIESKISRLVEENDEENKITWKKLSVLMDRVALVSYTAASVASFVIFLAITTLSSNEDKN